MTDCEKYTDMLSAYTDGELSEKERIELEKHIESCEECRSALEMYRMISENMAEDSEDVPESFAAGVMDKIEAYEKGNTKRKRSKLRSSWGRWIGTAACIAVILFAFPKMANLGCGASMDDGADTSGSAIMDKAESGDIADETDGMEADCNGAVEEKESTGSTNGAFDDADNKSEIGMIVTLYVEELPEELIPYSGRGNADGDTEYIVPVEIAEELIKTCADAEYEIIDADILTALVIVKK